MPEDNSAMYKAYAEDAIYASLQSYLLNKVKLSDGIENRFINPHLMDGLVYSYVKNNAMSKWLEAYLFLNLPDGLAVYAPQVNQLLITSLVDGGLNGFKPKPMLMASVSNVVASMVEPKVKAYYDDMMNKKQ